MKTRYLIRKRRQDIEGPYDGKELLPIIQNGQSDWEIAGHLKPWIFLGNEYLLNKTYPEISAAAKESLWGRVRRRLLLK
ncbi:MAG: hypothetical protein HYW48_02710 [Deltaproteobacteria bacterium]|nr:hypothetical protein [Deltaproteobacteria bacterium]